MRVHAISFPESLLPLSSGGTGNKDLCGEVIHHDMSIEPEVQESCHAWWIASPKRSLLPVKPLNKGNKDSKNEIGVYAESDLYSQLSPCGHPRYYRHGES